MRLFHLPHRLPSSLIAMALLPLLSACTSAQAAMLPTPAATATPKTGPAPTATALPTATPESACPLPDLVPGQHLSASGSYTQTETQAAGPMVCRIKRDACAYHYLIGNLDSTLVFKREEEPPYDREDILIHPAMLMPLVRLNDLVKAEWDGTLQLRITDAYDSLLEHDLAQSDASHKYSLHFEGRSIDLTTWPIEPATYGRLCALAHCAGFDWVHHEGDHCHASINAESLCLWCND